jgi:hypothetical protein
MVRVRRGAGTLKEFSMKHGLLLVLLCGAAYAAPCPTGQSKDESTLIQMEQTWARALEQRDTSALGCILAAEFEDAGPDGKLTDRAQRLWLRPRSIRRCTTSFRNCIRTCRAISVTSVDWRRRPMRKTRVWPPYDSRTSMCIAKDAGSVWRDMNLSSAR